MILFVSCDQNHDYKKMISKIEKDDLLEELKDFNFTQRGKFNWILNNDSIQFVYHKSDLSNYILSSTNNSIFDSLGKIYFTKINHPQKIFWYKSAKFYSAKRIYIENENTKSDSISIEKNDFLNSLFEKSNLYYNLNQNYNLKTFIYYKEQSTYEFILKPDERLFYVENPENISQPYIDLLKKGSQLHKNWFLVKL